MKTMTAMNSSSRTGRRYDREFKNNAVALVRGGRTVTEVARDLGVSKWSLGRWVGQAEAGQTLSEPKTLSVETAEQRELRRRRADISSSGIGSIAALARFHVPPKIRVVDLSQRSFGN